MDVHLLNCDAIGWMKLGFFYTIIVWKGKKDGKYLLGLTKTLLHT